MSATKLNRNDRDEILAFAEYLRSSTDAVRPLIEIPYGFRIYFRR